MTDPCYTVCYTIFYFGVFFSKCACREAATTIVNCMCPCMKNCDFRISKNIYFWNREAGQVIFGIKNNVTLLLHLTYHSVKIIILCLVKYCILWNQEAGQVSFWTKNDVTLLLHFCYTYLSKANSDILDKSNTFCMLLEIPRENEHSLGNKKMLISTCKTLVQKQCKQV